VDRGWGRRIKMWEVGVKAKNGVGGGSRREGDDEVWGRRIKKWLRLRMGWEGGR
jgi:hypothetical protein